jgi:hypothetical protein
MSKELEKRNQLTTQAGRKMDAALAKLGLANKEAREPGLSSVSEIAEIPRVCALFDKNYAAIYQKGSNGLFRYQRSLRLTDEQASSNGGTHITLDAVDIDPNGPPECCAWCGAAPQEAYGRQVNTVKCGGCHAFVCLGKTRDGFFQCRPSCGCAGALNNKWVSSEGTKHRAAPAQPVGASKLPERTLIEGSTALTTREKK